MVEYIDRETYITIVKDIPMWGNVAAMIAGSVPAADVAPLVHGRWLPQVVLGQKSWDCSECKTLGSPQWKWCPVCGAKMDGGAIDG